MTVGLFSLVLVNTSCIEETEPTSVATQAQAERSSSATKAQAMAIPAQFNAIDNDYIDNNSWHAPFGYPAMMIIRDMMGNDMGFPTSSYANHFYRFGACQYMGGEYIYAAYIWEYYYKLVLTANSVINVVNPETATKEQLGYLGAAYAVRAMAYLDLGRMYEFLPNDKTSSINSDGNDVLGLTVPIVTPTMTETEARNNPRVKKADLVTFIKGDIEKAKEYIPNVSDRLNRTIPNLACVYGLEARLNMWTEEYAAAATAAQNAITASGMTPLSEAVALDKASGMNTYSQFMWCCNLVKEDDAVQSGIVNWISHNGTFNYGYGQYSGGHQISKKLYNSIADTDIRKGWWSNDKGICANISDEWNKYLTETFKPTDKQKAAGIVATPYLNCKFSPYQGLLNNDVNANDIPLMRIEEMYLILAEAQQMAGQDGKSTLEKFVKTYRDPAYSCTASDIQNEIYRQKRIELWGEGRIWFDVMRLNKGVDRRGAGYEPNCVLKIAADDAILLWRLPQTEINGNSALTDADNNAATPVPTAVEDADIAL